MVVAGTGVSNVFGCLIPMYLSFMFFIVGLIVFTMARNMPVIIVGRILEGLGAGGLDVLNEIILASIPTLKERPTFLGFFTIPTLCGVFSGYVTWRWIGRINLLLSAVRSPPPGTVCARAS